MRPRLHVALQYAPAEARRAIEVVRSALTGRTVERRTAALHDALDLALAVAAGAGLAFAVIDREMMLEISKLAIRSRIIAQRRTAGFDRRAQHRLDRRNEPPRALARNRVRQSLGRNPRAEQRLADIDVAETRNDALIQQRGLDRRALAFQRLADSTAGVNASSSGSGPSPSNSLSLSSCDVSASAINPKRR